MSHSIDLERLKALLRGLGPVVALLLRRALLTLADTGSSVKLLATATSYEPEFIRRE